MLIIFIYKIMEKERYIMKYKPENLSENLRILGEEFVKNKKIIDILL